MVRNLHADVKDRNRLGDWDGVGLELDRIELPNAEPAFIRDLAQRVHGSRAHRTRCPCHEERPISGLPILADPLGLALENFNAIGEFRLRDLYAGDQAQGPGASQRIVAAVSVVCTGAVIVVPARSIFTQ